jgi:hypothetical protein
MKQKIVQDITNTSSINVLSPATSISRRLESIAFADSVFK